MFKKKKTGCETPKFRKPTAPPMPPVKLSKTNPPNVGSSVQRPKQHCHFETPCGWCAKWDKKCDKKISCGPLPINEAMHGWLEAYFKGARGFMEYLMAYARSGKQLYESEMKDILIEFAKQFGEVNGINTD